LSNFMRLSVVVTLSVAFLSACGGGGSSTPIVATQAVTSFPLQSGYKSLVAAGKSNNLTVSGTCSGSATRSVSTPSAGTFEGSLELAVTSTLTLNLTNCTPASSASTSVQYYDSNYVPIGHTASGVEYGKFLTIPNQLPTSVKIGDTAVYGAETIYSDSIKQTLKGQRNISYVIEQDGSSTSTSIVNLITKDLNTINQLLFTQQSRYRIVADGTLSLVSIDVQYSTTSSNHLVYTAN